MTRSASDHEGDPRIPPDIACEILRAVQSTHGPQILPSTVCGLFALDEPKGLFRRSYREPVLAASSGGLGEKLEIALRFGDVGGLGNDLVARCVNDIVAHGAEPLFFLAQVAVGKDAVTPVVSGIAAGCREARCAILGTGPGDLVGGGAAGKAQASGFAVGVVERRRMIDGARVEQGDAVLGLLSSGPHLGGFSELAEALLKGSSWMDGDAAREILAPTRIYARPILSVLRRYRVKRIVHGIAPITDGGLRPGLLRVLPEGASVVIRPASWDCPEIFQLLAGRCGVDEEEMYEVFNMGIGMVLLVAPSFADSIVRQLGRRKIPARLIGRVTAGPRRVEIRR